MVLIAGLLPMTPFVPWASDATVSAEAWSAPQRLSRIDTISTAPRVSTNAAGAAAAVWLRVVDDEVEPEEPVDPNAPVLPPPCGSKVRCVLDAARFDPASNTWSEPVRLSEAGTGAAEPDVIIDDAGTAIAVWRDTTTGRIRASVSVGRTWSSPVGLSTPDTGGRAPQLVVGPRASFTAVWYRPQTQVNVVESARFVDGQWTAPAVVASEPGAVLTGVAGDRTGKVLAVWRSQPDGATNPVIRASRYSGSWGAPVTLSSPAATEADNAQVAVDADGNATAVWQQSDTEFLRITTNRFDVATGEWDGPRMMPSDGGNAVSPRVASDRDGNVTVIWRATNSVGVQTVRASRSAAGGNAWTPAVLSSSVRPTQSQQLEVDGSGYVTAVWRSVDTDGNWIVQAARYSPVTGQWGAARDLSRAGADASIPVADIDANGEVVVLWARKDAIEASRSSNRSGFVAITPVRVFDTRPGESPNALLDVAEQKVGGAYELVVDLASLPGGATPGGGFNAVSLNVTVVDPDLSGYLTAYPCGARPHVSNLNFQAGQIVSNAVIAPVSPAGLLCFASNTPVHVVVDLNGWFPSLGGLTPVGPVRVLDTRPGESTNALVAVPKSPIGGATALRVMMTSLPGSVTPRRGMSAVSLNVTAVNPATSGYLTVYPCGTLPTVSSLNFVAGQVVSNAVVTPLSSTGELCIASSAPTDVVVDLAGWFATESSYEAVPAPARVFDTRPQTSPDALLDLPKGRIGGVTQLQVRMVDLAGVTPPLGVEAVSLNVTVTRPAADGFLTVHPCGVPNEVSNVNFLAGETVANAVLAPLSASGDLCFFSNVLTHVVVDINGYFAVGG